MNKAITDGLVLTPTPFAAGLDVWSSGDGTAGSDTYENAANALFVAADQNFAGSLELLKTQNTQKLRYMGQTPILPGCYLQISVRVKAVSGNLPSVRIAGYPAHGNGARVNGLPEFSTFTTLQNYGEVVEVKAIIGTGSRGGVDLVWGTEPVYGHFGIDLVGPNGGIIRVDDIQIEDVTSVFVRDMISIVDVVDYGAIGNGNTDNTAAFEAANSAANGRTVFVPEGNFRLAQNVTVDTPVKFEGRVSMPDTAVLLLRRNFDLPTYIEAFEDEELAFKKAFQALLNNSDHETLDMGGRKVNVTAPLDMAGAVPGTNSYATRRVIRNGQLEAAAGAAWNTEVFTSGATYSAGNSRTLTDVTNVASIAVGSLVEGTGVGREVYVRSKDLARQEITLNKPLFDAEGRQNLTFRKFKYLIDFSGFNALSKFVMADVELQCNDRCSAIMLSPGGITFHIRDCFISRPMDRGITSIGTGCQGLIVDRCQFLSAEDALAVPARKTIGFNVNQNDAKIRNNRATRFRHFGLLGGSNNIFIGNHFFQGDGVANGVRSAGIILASTSVGTVISNNYIDNCFIEWTNEHDPSPAFTGGFSFSALSVADNMFLSGEVAPWFSYIVVKPHGAGHFLNGVSISGNRFRSLNGFIDRAERVDTSFADLDMSRCKNFTMAANSFLGVTAQPVNPAYVDFTQGTVDDNWTIDVAEYLAFGGEALSVDAVTAIGPLRNGNNVKQFETPYVDTVQGANRDQIRLVWPSEVRGKVQATVRMDFR
ncbi:right-handed parallel beta-helix repeat-containing protein [Sulfitobacter sp. M57]|uniref:glycosyl hydrolase family 28-related protein n=1 Tax=unclassified Sulfitobacter TaxID=196795 RepID=UPI0023E0C0AB|nr:MULTISPECIES: glycosyl hydrolase family 28-related protein [unclassified Sulfitobacter]MDF3414492.1 right-handed parallel beta-helix repeat-containing protein [Sulfitobacter sp. KE5]MDF3421973.1 right-handed parallel beta-helix repeat-containing protein [Sulfitobacter sp. KE43]MDF3433038.1 right-handed parallel beta-helix repeat-containing protein [Sulfitobacter sp. KE42]MDF3458678.1 right-handed parallel beta-helix repeat-containing protein [Sulfitobacter sp. S74]MDF3462578.1 right-handed 